MQTLLYSVTFRPKLTLCTHLVQCTMYPLSTLYISYSNTHLKCIALHPFLLVAACAHVTQYRVRKRPHQGTIVYKGNYLSHWIYRRFGVVPRV